MSKKVAVMKNDSLKSVYVVGNYNYGPLRGVLYEFQISKDGQVVGGHIQTLQDDDEESSTQSKVPFVYPVHSFFDEPLGPYCLSLLQTAVFSSKLYLLLDKYGYVPAYPLKDLPRSADGLIFDPHTKFWTSISRPVLPKPCGVLLSAYGKLYCLAGPESYSHLPDSAPSFERFDPTTGSGSSEVLPPCSFYSAKWGDLIIAGYAVCSGCILFSLQDWRTDESELMLFHVEKLEWHKVRTPKNHPFFRKFNFHGRAVVVHDVIYAPTYNKYAEGQQVMTFNLKLKLRVDTRGCLEYIYYIHEPVLLPILKTPPRYPFTWMETFYMVHLGGLQFCMVLTGLTHQANHRQHACITTFQVIAKGGKPLKIDTNNSSFRDLYLPTKHGLHIVFGFTPNHEDVETKENKKAMAAKLKKARASYARKKISAIHSINKKLGDYKDKIPAETKNEIELSLSGLKKAMEDENVNEIKASLDVAKKAVSEFFRKEKDAAVSKTGEHKTNSSDEASSEGESLDKIPAKTKNEIELSLSGLKKAMEDVNVNEIEASLDAVNKAVSEFRKEIDTVVSKTGEHKSNSSDEASSEGGKLGVPEAEYGEAKK